MKDYEIIISKRTLRLCEEYVTAIKNDHHICGKYLKLKINDLKTNELTPNTLIDLLLKTKVPQIFAESEILGNGQDWNQVELEILGGVSTYINVRIFDNALHTSPLIYQKPFKGHLLYIAGALLRNDLGEVPPDKKVLSSQNEIPYEKFYSFYENRILPSLKFASNLCLKENKKGLITIPGIGCGQFAGLYKYQVKNHLAKFIVDIFTKRQEELLGINCVYFDSFDHGKCEEFKTNHATIYFRPLTKCKNKQGQLTRPNSFIDIDPTYKNNDLFSIVAWDHVSWPGNDFWTGHRATDDGVKAAATDTMFRITGLQGEYHIQSNKFSPINSNKTWATLAKENRFEFSLNRKPFIY